MCDWRSPARYHSSWLAADEHTDIVSHRDLYAVGTKRCRVVVTLPNLTYSIIIQRSVQQRPSVEGSRLGRKSSQQPRVFSGLEPDRMSPRDIGEYREFGACAGQP